MVLGPLGERLVHADTATRKPVDPLFYPTYIFVRPPTVCLHRGTDEWYLVRSRPAGRFRSVLTGHCTQWRTPTSPSCIMFRWMNRSYSRRFHRRAIPRKTERHCYVSNVQSIYLNNDFLWARADARRLKGNVMKLSCTIYIYLNHAWQSLGTCGWCDRAGRAPKFHQVLVLNVYFVLPFSLHFF
jgi:hypothetical protein